MGKCEEANAAKKGKLQHGTRCKSPTSLYSNAVASYAVVSPITLSCLLTTIELLLMLENIFVVQQI